MLLKCQETPRSLLQVALKVGAVGNLTSGIKMDASSARLQETVDTALSLLRRPCIDVVIQARQSPDTPLADVMHCFKRLVEAGADIPAVRGACSRAAQLSLSDRRVACPALGLWALLAPGCATICQAVSRPHMRAGKVKYVGLSEVNAAQIREAHAIHPLSCIEQEWSLWSRDLEADLVPTCKELGIGILAYAPLGRGFLTGPPSPCLSERSSHLE